MQASRIPGFEDLDGSLCYSLVVIASSVRTPRGAAQTTGALVNTPFVENLHHFPVEFLFGPVAEKKVCQHN